MRSFLTAIVVIGILAAAALVIYHYMGQHKSLDSPPNSAQSTAAPAATVPTNAGTPQLEKTTAWTAASNTAMSITGDIETTPHIITIAKVTYPVVLVRDLHGDELQSSANLLALETPIPTGTEGRLYSIHIPASVKLLRGNTLCGGDGTAWLLAVISHGGESSGASGADLYLAFFSGAAEPVLQTQALNNSTALCGTFNYEQAASSPAAPGPH